MKALKKIFSKTADSMLRVYITVAAFVSTSPAFANDGDNRSIFSEEDIKAATDSVEDNLMIPRIILLIACGAWGILMWISVLDSRRWYLPLGGLFIAYFMVDMYTWGIANIAGVTVN